MSPPTATAMLEPIILQCSRFAADGNYTDALANGSFMDAVTCPPINQVGAQAFPMLVFGTIGLALYVYTESVVVPLVLAIIVGSVFMASMGAPPANVATIVLVMVITFAVYLVYVRMGRT